MPSRRRKSSSSSDSPRSRRGSSKTRRDAGKTAEREPELGFDELEAIDDDGLELLEPVDDDALDTLEAWDDESDPRSTITHDPVPESQDAALCIRIHVDPEVPKPEILDAFEANLRRLVEGKLAAAVKWRPVVVVFEGDAIIPSAAKATVGAILAAGKSARGVIQRGYGDEQVHEGTVPTVELELAHIDKDGLRAKFSCGDVEDADLASLLVARVGDLAGRISERRHRIVLESATDLEAGDRDKIRDVLVHAGATHVALDVAGVTRVLYDSELARLVQRAKKPPAEFDLAFEVAPPSSGDASDLLASLRLQPTDVLARIDEGRVCLAGDAPTALALMPHLVEAGAATIALATDGNRIDVVHPPTLQLREGANGPIIEVAPPVENVEDTDLVRTLERELPGHAAEISGRGITFDWPDGRRVEPASALARAAEDGAVQRGAKAVAFSFGGKDRVPIHPTPVELSDDGTRCTLDMDAGKPAELLRAIEQRIASPVIRDFRCRDRVVTIELQGEGLASRSLRASLAELFTRGEAQQVVLDDRGERQTLAPALVRREDDAGDGGSILLDVSSRGERDDALLGSDLAREIADLDLQSGCAVRIDTHGDGGMETQVLDALAAAVETASVTVAREGASDLRIAPALLTASPADDDAIEWTAAPADELDEDALVAQVEHELSGLHPDRISGKALTIQWAGATRPFGASLQLLIDRALAAQPGSIHLVSGDGRRRQLHPVLPRTYVRVLGTRNQAVPPMTMLAIDASEGAEDVAPIEAALEALPLDSLQGRRVLLVFERDGREVAFGPRHPAVALLRSKLEGLAVAVLERREVSGLGSAFVVVQSGLEALPVDMLVQDPRGSGLPAQPEAGPESGEAGSETPPDGSDSGEEPSAANS